MNEHQDIFRLKNLTERIPLDLSRFVEDQQRRIFFTSLTLDNKPGTLALVLALLLRYNINILGILSEAISKKDELEITFSILALEEKFKKMLSLADEKRVKKQIIEKDIKEILPANWGRKLGGKISIEKIRKTAKISAKLLELFLEMVAFRKGWLK